MNELELMKCTNCNGLNIQYDLESGKTFCNNCNSNTKIKKINIDEYKNEIIENEKNNLNNIKIIDTKASTSINTKNINDFSKLGL